MRLLVNGLFAKRANFDRIYMIFRIKCFGQFPDETVQIASA